MVILLLLIQGNNMIKIFTTDGQFVRKIGGPGMFQFPCPLCSV